MKIDSQLNKREAEGLEEVSTELLPDAITAARSANIVIDISHHNGKVDLVAAKGAGISGIIHKATQGWRYRDPLYFAHHDLALSAGLLWGAYHFGVGADGVAQADFFLSLVKPDPATLLVLDFEANTAGPSMDVLEARAFVTHVQHETGRWPGLYAGQYLKELLRSTPDDVLSKCWLWLAQYGRTAVLPPGWNTWTMWQYTDGAVGPEPHEVAGIGHCDRDLFHGAEADLAPFWKDNAAPIPAQSQAVASDNAGAQGPD